MAIGPKNLRKYYPRRPGEVIPEHGRLPTYAGGDVGGDAQRAGSPGDELSGDTRVWTIFTETGGTHEIYTPTTWVKCRLVLTTAGPVAVGTQDKLDPVTAGKGFLLPTDQPIEISLGKGSSLYYAADAINRVGVIIEPIPWLREIASAAGSIPRRLSEILGGLRGGR